MRADRTHSFCVTGVFKISLIISRPVFPDSGDGEVDSSLSNNCDESGTTPIAVAFNPFIDVVCISDVVLCVFVWFVKVNEINTFHMLGKYFADVCTNPKLVAFAQGFFGTVGTSQSITIFVVSIPSDHMVHKSEEVAINNTGRVSKIFADGNPCCASYCFAELFQLESFFEYGDRMQGVEGVLVIHIMNQSGFFQSEGTFVTGPRVLLVFGVFHCLILVDFFICGIPSRYVISSVPIISFFHQSPPCQFLSGSLFYKLFKCFSSRLNFVVHMFLLSAAFTSAQAEPRLSLPLVFEAKDMTTEGDFKREGSVGVAFVLKIRGSGGLLFTGVSSEQAADNKYILNNSQPRREMFDDVKKGSRKKVTSVVDEKFLIGTEEITSYVYPTDEEASTKREWKTSETNFCLGPRMLRNVGGSRVVSLLNGQYAVNVMQPCPCSNVRGVRGRQNFRARRALALQNCLSFRRFGVAHSHLRQRAHGIDTSKCCLVGVGQTSPIGWRDCNLLGLQNQQIMSLLERY
jgi:hypothetical protein